MRKIEVIQSAKLAVSPGPFSTGVKANGFLFLSGQVGIDQGGKLAENGYLLNKPCFPTSL